MNIRDAIEFVLKNYARALNEPLAGNPVAGFVRRSFPQIVGETVSTEGDLLVEGSAGQGQWAKSPWVAIFDPMITDSAQRGYYPVYLFREDLSGVYLSLNQGVTEVRERYKSEAKSALRARAGDMAARIGKLELPFSTSEIDLRPSAAANNSAFYESGNIFSVFYDGRKLPDNRSLEGDLRYVLRAYSSLSASDPDLASPAMEDDEQENRQLEEDHSKIRAHKRIERNPKISKAVKKAQGWVCRACGFDFRSAYPGISENQYIEAHHLVPISQLKGRKLSRDPIKDFAVLCANCHRMIHRFDQPHNIEAFRKALLF